MGRRKSTADHVENGKQNNRAALCLSLPLHLTVSAAAPCWPLLLGKACGDPTGHTELLGFGAALETSEQKLETESHP